MKNKTEFIRVIKNRNYTVLNNKFLKRKDLSWKAKGILAYILSLPDDWNINLNEVMRHATEGESAFRSGWKELEETGYVERYPVKDEKTKRIIHWETVVRESVDVSAPDPHSDFPHMGNPHLDKPHVGNRKLLSTKELSTNIQNTNNTKEHVSDSKESDVQLPKKELSTKKKKSPFKYNDIQHDLASYLFKKVKANFPITKKPNLESWANDIRLMMEQDDRKEKEIKQLIDWSQRDDFWYANIRSTSSLRRQYENLYAQAHRAGGLKEERNWETWDFMG